MPDIGNRHRGTLGGRFTDARIPANVTIALSAEAANRPPLQHLAWMLVNLLARQPGEIAGIGLEIPKGVAAVPWLTPLAEGGGDLVDTLGEGAARINPGIFSPKRDVRSRIFVRIGPGPLDAADFALSTTAAGWGAYVGQVPTTIAGTDNNTVGAYAAACLCAGEIFKFVRAMGAANGAYANRLWLDGYTLAALSAPPAFRELPADIDLAPAVVAGVGAVANGFLHTLYPLIGARGDLLLIDHDPEGIADTNLNRYILFGQSQIGAPKATTAAGLFAGRWLNVLGVDTSWQEWRVAHPEMPLDLVISAVDKNSARHAIQDALPRVILGAATNEMRLQVECHDALGGGPCLRCYNPVEATTSDAEIIARLRKMALEERVAHASVLGVTPDQLKLFLTDPQKHCGLIAGSTLQKFGAETAQPAWSVGFVSALAGVLLAGEYMKRSLAQPLLDASHPAFHFQFWRPESAAANRIVQTRPEAGCRCRKRAFRQALATRFPRSGGAEKTILGSLV